MHSRFFPATPRAQLNWLMTFALLHALAILLIGLDKPLLDQHEFRQTQTALTAYWILQDGPSLAYETPVLGAPWAIPFEFPVYQTIVAAIAFIGVPLEIAGRLVSFSFFLGALWPLRVLFREAKYGDEAFLITAVLYLLSPVYLYWGRTFMIESCALFFAMTWLAMLVRFLNRPGFLVAASAVTAGTLGVLAKATTFPAFAAVGGLFFAYKLFCKWRAGQPIGQLGILTVSAALIAVIPLATGFAWVAYSDAFKSMNTFGDHLTSKNLAKWNFGDLAQRTSSRLWIDVILRRALPDALGFLFPLALLATAAALIKQRFRAVLLVMAGAFLLPFLVFTNLHIVHNYYQSANAIFAIVMTGLAVSAVFRAERRRTAQGLLTALIAGQLVYFHTQFTRYLVRDYSDNRLMNVALLARDNTPAHSALLVLGDDWASTVPYYARRKSLTLPAWSSQELMRRTFENPEQFLGGLPLGGIVYCADRAHMYGEAAGAIAGLIENRKLIGEFSGCQLFGDIQAGSS